LNFANPTKHGAGCADSASTRATNRAAKINAAGTVGLHAKNANDHDTFLPATRMQSHEKRRTHLSKI
jgi:hypothetical protein